jgi:exonuclease III
LSASRNNDIELDHHHNQKGGTNESIVQWNTNDLRNNFEELKILTEELDPTIVCLQETNVKQEQQTIFGRYEVFSKTVHAERAKQGVAILVKKGIKAERLKLKMKLNAVAARIEMKRTIKICSLYIPPSEIASKKKLQHLVRQLPRSLIITRELNGHSVGIGEYEAADQAAIDALNEEIGNQEPTHLRT